MLHYLLNHCFANEGSDSHHLAPDKHQFLVRNLNSSLAARRLVQDWSTYTLGRIIGFWLNYSILSWGEDYLEDPQNLLGTQKVNHSQDIFCFSILDIIVKGLILSILAFSNISTKKSSSSTTPTPQYYSSVCFWKSLHIEKFSQSVDVACSKVQAELILQGKWQTRRLIPYFKIGTCLH